MRHQKAGRKFGRSTAHRKAMSRNLVIVFARPRRIQTTEAKGKNYVRWVEKGSRRQTDNVAARRAVDAFVEDPEVTERLFTKLMPRMKDRPVLHEVLKIGPRLGDGAKHGPDRARRPMNVKLTVEYARARATTAGKPRRDDHNRVSAARRDHVVDGRVTRAHGGGPDGRGCPRARPVVNFKLERDFPVQQLPGALNARLASDISVRHAELVDESFNARYSARAALRLSHSPGAAS